MKTLRTVLTVITLISLVSCDKGNKTQVSPVACLPSNLHSSVVAFYPFSKGSLNDISGKNRHLSNSTSATPTSDRNGNANCAYIFNNKGSANEYLNTTSTEFLNNLSSFSVSLWYQALDTLRDGADYEGLIHRDSSSYKWDIQGQWSMGLYDCRKPVFGRREFDPAWDTTYNWTYTCEEQINLLTGEWKHLVGTFNNANSTISIYTNGQLIDSKGPLSSSEFAYDNIGDLFIGKNYTGKIDDVIIFNKSLNLKEVQSLYYLETCCVE